MKKIVLATLVLIGVMSITVEASEVSDMMDRICNGSYNGLIQDQQKAVNYNSLSSKSKESLNASIISDVNECLKYCSGTKFNYCDSVQKKIEEKQKLAKSKSWF